MDFTARIDRSEGGANHFFEQPEVGLHHTTAKYKAGHMNNSGYPADNGTNPNQSKVQDFYALNCLCHGQKGAGAR